jgi:protein subunit release factor A
MKYELFPIWNEYKGQEFKTGDCSPLSRSVSQRYCIWEKEGDWEKKTKKKPKKERFRYWFDDQQQKMIKEDMKPVKVKKPRLENHIMERFISEEEDLKIKEILTEILNVTGGWWNKVYQDRGEQSRWEKYLKERKRELDGELSEIHPTHRYFDYCSKIW